MKILIILLLSLVFTGCFSNKAEKIELKKNSPEIHKISYSLGAQYAKSVSAIELDKISQELLVQGFQDYQGDKSRMRTQVSAGI